MHPEAQSAIVSATALGLRQTRSTKPGVRVAGIPATLPAQRGCSRKALSCWMAGASLSNLYTSTSSFSVYQVAVDLSSVVYDVTVSGGLPVWLRCGLNLAHSRCKPVVQVAQPLSSARRCIA
jgi:hypothetical protein